MPLYTIEQLRTVARGKDNRLANASKYADSWIDDKIDHAFETAESGRQVFHMEEVVDLKPYIADGVDTFTIEADFEVHSYYQLATTHPQDLSIVTANDNRVNVTIKTDMSNIPDDITITMRYFYYPHTPFTSIFMQSEVYHYWRHCLYVNLYGSLRDKENEMYHQEQVDKFIREGTFSTPHDFEQFIEMKGGFDLRESGNSWL